VVRKPGSELTGAEVLALFEGRIARYKHPRAVLFMAELPRNAMGKVLKFELRESLAAGERNGDPA
jgi:acyl-coenzyme A synthetase/AMP-(fatty) acid ligase